MRSEFPEAMYPSQMINYSFTILPPWWHTWWFFIGVSLAILGILFLGTSVLLSQEIRKGEDHFRKAAGNRKRKNKNRHGHA